MEQSLRKIENIALKSRNPLAICIALEGCQNIRNSILSCFTYTHSDMNDEDLKQLNKINNVPIDSIWQGGDCLSVVNNVLITIKQFDPYAILHDINFIVRKRKNGENITSKKINS